jgi:flagellar hook-basal body complex protein FliE
MKIDSFKAAGLSDMSANETKNFGAAIRGAIDNVVASQETSKVTSEQFAMGNKNVTLIDAKLSSSIAEVKTQILIASTQKVLKAYRDISNMSV